MEFRPFPKIPRLRRDCTITEASLPQAAHSAHNW